MHPNKTLIYDYWFLVSFIFGKDNQQSFISTINTNIPARFLLVFLFRVAIKYNSMQNSLHINK